MSVVISPVIELIVPAIVKVSSHDVVGDAEVDQEDEEHKQEVLDVVQCAEQQLEVLVEHVRRLQVLNPLSEH